MPNLPMVTAMADVEVRYKKGNDMLLSAIIGLKELLVRFDAGEADEEGRIWTWPEYRDERFRYKAAKGDKPLSISWANTQQHLARSDDPAAALAGERKRHTDSMQKFRNGVPAKDGGFKALCKAWENADPEARKDFLIRFRLTTHL